MKRRIKNIYHLLQAIVARFYYWGLNSPKIKVIGVTGTDGKTTTTHLIYHILKKNRIKSSMISTIYATIAGKKYSTGLHVTTPNSFFVQRSLKLAEKRGEECFVLETTAHAIDQDRVWGVPFLISVITNVTHEHLKSVGGYDYFSSLTNYLYTKLKLLFSSKTAVVNCDDPLLFESLEEIKKRTRTVTYGFKEGCDYTLNFSSVLKKKIPKFNEYNFLAAYAVCRELGIPKEKIIDAVRTFHLPPGRVELVYKKRFEIYIDFAHTINGIRNILIYLGGKGKRIIHVFGAAGLRDRTKRRLMGEESAKRSNSIILTEEDYRTEDPYLIAKEIGKGIKRWGFRYVRPEDFVGEDKTYTIIIHRMDAIKKAICVAKEGDLVVLTGKSHEASLARGRKEYPWNEKKAVEKALKICYNETL